MDYKNYKKMLFHSTINLMIVTSILSVIIASLNFVVPILLSWFIDQYQAEDKTMAFLCLLGAVYLAAYLAKMALNWVFMRYAVQFKTKRHMELLDMMFRMKYESLNQKEPTYLAERIAVSANRLYDIYGESVSKVVVAGVSILISLAIMVRIKIIFAVILVLLFFLQLLGYKKINESLQNKSEDLQINAAENFKNILSITSKIDYIKQEGSYQGMKNILAPFVKSIHYKNAEVGKFAKDVSTTLSSVITALQNGIYLGSSIFLLQGSITPADFVVISMVSGLYIAGIGDLVKVNLNLRDRKGVNEFIEKELLANMEEEEGENIDSIQSISFAISGLGYGDRILIEEGAFEAKKGDVIFLSGASGTGKTTLVKGLLKFLPVNKIDINGVNINSLACSAIRSKIQFFSQNIPIIAGTIKENILLGKKVENKFWEKLEKKPFLKKFYELPDGLDTVVLENGSNLSGGDKQKIALARMDIENPDVIILDESTNSIDTKSAYEMIELILSEYADKIIFLISHDNQLERYCNKIVRLCDKKLILEKNE